MESLSISTIQVPYVWFLFAAIAGFVFIVMALSYPANTRRVLTGIGATLGLGSGVVVMTLGFINVGLQKDFDSVLQEQIKDTYGLELTTEEVRALDYPSEIPAASGKKIPYGWFEGSITNESNELVFARVTLVYVDGEFQLLQDSDSSAMVELPRA